MAWSWHSLEAKGDLSRLNDEINEPTRHCRIVHVIGKPAKGKAV